MFDIQKNARKDQDIIQEVIFPYLMLNSLAKIPQDKDGKEVPQPWLEIIAQESFKPITECTRGKQVAISKKVGRLSTKVIKSTQRVKDYKSLALAISCAFLELVRQGKILDVSTQVATVCIKIVEENLEYKDWGSNGVARRDADLMIKTLQEEGYFRTDQRDGSNIIT